MHDWLVCPRASALLSEFEADLRKAAYLPDEAAAVIASHVVTGGGKRLRPALLLLAGQFGNADPEKLKRAAAAMELLHVASLYHDDVMDRAGTRRGAASANALWGNRPAVCAGVLLFARAIQLLSSLGDEANRLASAAAVRLCTGQLQEVENAYNLDLRAQDHLAILEKKTATLFELPCRLGALLAEAPAATTRVLEEYARALGLAFQLADDALDLSGDERTLGKPTLSDIREGVYSLPVIYALRGDTSGSFRSLLRKTSLSSAELSEVASHIRRSGAVKTARERARRLARRASSGLAPLADTPARESLRRLAAFAVARSN